MYGCCYPVFNDYPCFPDRCCNILPPNCTPCMPCPTFPPIIKKEKVPDFEKELELKKLLAAKCKESRSSKKTKSKGKSRTSCKCGQAAQTSQASLPSCPKNCGICNCSKEKVTGQERKRMAPISEEDEECRCDEPTNPLQDSMANFLTIINESVCETVQKCIDSMLSDFFDQTLERLNGLCTQMVRNECLISKLYLDAMDRFSRMEERNCEQMKAMCDAVSENMLQRESMSDRQEPAPKRNSFPNRSEESRPSLTQESIKKTCRKASRQSKEPQRSRSSRQQNFIISPRKTSESNNLETEYPQNLSKCGCDQDRSARMDFATSTQSTMKSQVRSCNDNNCPYRSQNSNHSTCSCAESTNRDRSARQNELLLKYRKLSNCQNI
ncbi:uncharacterized protein LOC119685144 [Teleopsis dalmanni]|uniref:uncharacterized protein LOC119685144 n=1 Tax=Teleopsis dalmanni TaxID=139649 RepID=UPI0018CE1CDA|nr:uncharacterized protein LOC119685144 [Teleopsis dalmanni]